ncbi:MAG: DUF1015 domain-containing protein, partial [Coriobacteriia bacterium]|nr:DUF1015 domain-containing protein [Coriobacteriia bacterium]
MARIRPFCAHTYARTSPDITPLVAPPYDVIDDAERTALLARSPHNVVALELAEGPLDPLVADNRYETAAKRWQAWSQEGVISQDDTPALYLLEQRFEFGASHVRRRALIAEVGLHAFDEGVVLPHERTLPKALGDRFNLIKATGVNFSQVLGLLHDPEHSVVKAFNAVSDTPPTLSATDDAGVESLLWALTDSRRINLITEALADQRIFIADGHHRYTVALAYRDERRSDDDAAGRKPEGPDYDYVMMALVDMDDPELVVLPTHRVAAIEGSFDPAEFYARMAEHFDVRETGPEEPTDVLEVIESPAFL